QSCACGVRRGREGVAERDGRGDLQVVGVKVNRLELGGELRYDGAGGAVDEEHLPVDTQSGEYPAVRADDPPQVVVERAWVQRCLWSAGECVNQIAVGRG